MNRSNLVRGYPIALISSAILATTAIFIRYLTETYHLPALVLAFWRDSFVAISLLPVLYWLRPQLLRVKRQALPYLLAYGLLLACFNSAWILSVAVNGAAIATILVYCSTAFTVVLAWWLLREGLGWGKLLAVAFALGGCVLVADALNPGAWHSNPVGILTGLLSGLCYAIYSLMGRSAAQRGLNPWTTLGYTFGFAACFLLVFNLLPGGFLPGAAARPADLFWLRSSLAGWAILFAVAAGPTLLGFGLYNVSLSYLPSGVVNLVATSEPVFTAAIAYVLLGERLSGIQIAGSLLILAGVVFLRLYEGRQAERLEPEPPRPAADAV
jgi:drug/metabolite transporter (DMT)-like permease